jgi:subtilase family serine protease
VRRAALLAGLAAVTTAAAVGTTGTTATAAPGHASARPVPAVAGHVLTGRTFAAPPTTADCRQQIGISCYSPLQFEQAYDVHKAWDAGYTGRGRTIVIVDAFGSPTIAQDLAHFDADFGLPAPPSLKVLSPVGAIPAYTPTSERVGWAFESTLDVEYAHAIAPEANIVLVTTPVAETEGVTGFPEIVAAENYVIDHGIGDVITQSFGATENTFPSRKSLTDLRSAFLNARAHHVTVLASSGDSGVTNATVDGSTLYPFPANSWPSSDPLVTSIGGTQLHLDAAGNRTAPDQVWNDGYGAAGGGSSLFFARPAFQDPVRALAGDQRATPDISMSAAVDGAALVYLSFPGLGAGYHLVGGTSEASPIFAGVVAIAAQMNGGRLGDVNPALYQLGVSGLRTGIVDVTKGDISFGGVTGPAARKGYDLASGWGTVDASAFATALSQQVTTAAAQAQVLVDR